MELKINDLGQTVDESGQIKCLDKDGNVKWFSPLIVNNRHLLDQQGITVFLAPVKFEFEEKKNESYPKGNNGNETGETELKPIEDYTRDQLKEEITKLSGTFKPNDGKESLYNTLKSLQTNK